MLIFITLN